MRRQLALTTDNREEAYVELQKRRGARDGAGWDMAEVRRMEYPIHTVHTWAVFRDLDEEVSSS